MTDSEMPKEAFRDYLKWANAELLNVLNECKGSVNEMIVAGFAAGWKARDERSKTNKT